MTTPLPDDLSSLGPERLHEARVERDEQTATLFRRWPVLTKVEMSDLRRLWNERLRIARHLGSRRPAR